MGYLPSGFLGYADELRRKAAALGIAERFEYLGAIPRRAELMRLGSECHVGLCLLRITDEDINMRHMAGASNKPFDYLSHGIALIVPEDPEWQRLYVEAGCAKSCPSHDAEALAEVLRWMAEHRAAVAEMGRCGQRLVRERWNYEAQFAPVLERMNEGS
jgi:glycosyltransferase involved in cell wall biosynthesis